MKKNCETKEFSSKDSQDIFSHFSKKYSQKIDSQALQKLIQYKAGHERKIASEIEKLLITREKITISDIEQYVAPELEESIFQLVDDILNKQYQQALKKLHIQLNDTNIFLLYNSLLANLRTSLYIMKLKTEGKTNNIADILQLGNRGFLVNKNYAIGYQELEKKFLQLVEIDKKMKTGKLMGSEEEVIL